MNRPHVPLSDAVLRRILQDTAPWLSCDDCFRLLDAYVEQVLADPACPGWTPMETHLAACQACHEEAQALTTLVAEELGADPQRALRRISPGPG